VYYGYAIRLLALLARILLIQERKTGRLEKKIVVWTARNFGADEVLSAAEILCVFQSGQAHSCVKRPGVPPARFFESQPKIKRERGEKTLRPAIHPFRV
jgi:hypothetical protein